MTCPIACRSKQSRRGSARGAEPGTAVARAPSRLRTSMSTEHRHLGRRQWIRPHSAGERPLCPLGSLRLGYAWPSCVIAKLAGPHIPGHTLARTCWKRRSKAVCCMRGAEAPRLKHHFELNWEGESMAACDPPEVHHVRRERRDVHGSIKPTKALQG